ncbi:MAG: hypothetical protein ACO2O1_07555 [Candidatus Caldarchaeales archaeon]
MLRRRPTVLIRSARPMISRARSRTNRKIATADTTSHAFGIPSTIVIGV